ncbi:MAG: hypothetical protein KKE42_15640, partial [Alphaproteobacteria bacterium]|nr:hypothetical protein [Alphaproteobacteria bacterium]
MALAEIRLVESQIAVEVGGTALLAPLVAAAGAHRDAAETAEANAETAAGTATTKAGEAAASAATALTNAANATRARSHISGRISALSWSLAPFGATSVPTVTLTAGYHWEENNSGTFKRNISALGATALSAGQAIAVDFSTGTDPWTPAVIFIGSSAAPDWQTTSAYILVGRDAQGTLFGPYVDCTPDLMFSDKAARNARKVMTGNATVNADGTIDFSLGYLHNENISGVPEKTIDTYAAAPALGTNEAYFADIVAGPFSSGKVTLTKGLIGGSLYTGWVSGDRYVVLAKDANGVYSAPTGYRLKLRSDPAPDIITAVKAGSQINLISPISNGRSVNFVLKRITDVANRVDIWLVSRVWLATGTGAVFSSVRPYTEEGEHEIAIKMLRVPAASDFMGGFSHGDQTATVMKLFVDGVDITSAADGTYTGGELSIIQRSSLTDPDEAGNPVRFYLDSEHTLRARGRLRYRGCLTAAGTPQVIYDYIGMMKPTLTYSSANVMTKAYLEEPWQEIDLTGTIPSGLVTKGRKVRYTSPQDGMFMTMEITQGWTASGRQLYVAPASPTGKAYFNQHGNSSNYTYANGERVE